MKKIVRRILSVVPAVCLQILWIFTLLYWLAPYAAIINLLLSFFAILYVLYIMSSRNESTYKTLWLLVILGMPVLGTILYLCFGDKKTARPLQARLKQSRAALPQVIPKNTDTLYTALEQADLRFAQTLHYIQNMTGFPVLPCEDTEYFPLGENLFARMLIDLETAKHFIFAEYFIIENGRMFDSIVDVMARKAAQGIDVRLMYDDLGSLPTFSASNRKQLQEKGIRCVPFNPLVFVKGTLNYRDHRKMLIIDNRIAFSGGVNLADEYINQTEKHGHWKDIGFRVTGDPVHNFTRMFAEFWNAFSLDPIPETAFSCLPAFSGTGSCSNGCVLSYYDSPTRPEAVSNTLYVELLSQATRFAWFFTPYLMLGDTLMEAFVQAAERGVDVRIIMPGIPDKALVYRMSRSYYTVLLNAGVKIYEYTPGFVHAKACLVDDQIGTIGTVNLDYRSLFLHFENNSLFYRASLLADLKEDFLAVQSRCQERTLDNIGQCFRKWLFDGVLRIFAPLC